MRKILTSIAIIAITLTATVSAASAATGNPSAAIHISPVSYQQWKAAGNSYPAGFELFCFNYARLSSAGREAYSQLSVANQSKLKTFGEYTVSELLKDFRKAWTNGSGYSYRIQK